jgi:hypothetical protein
LTDLTPLESYVLRQLDGQTDRATLTAKLELAVASGEIAADSMHVDQPPPPSLPDALELCFRKLTHCALLLD